MKSKTFSLLLFVVLTFTHMSHAGENFTKISDSGAELSDSASDWSCVKHNITGQMWEVKKTTNMSDVYSFGNRLNHKNRVNQTGLCGYDDWRIPTVKELNSITDKSRSNPATDTEYFPNTMSTSPNSSTPGYWTNSPKLDARPHVIEAWGVNFWRGITMSFNQGFFLFVRLVRGENYYDFFDYSKLDDSGNLLAENNSDHSCVLDNRSGLTWEVKTDANMDDEYTFTETPDHTLQINQSNLCGYADWRLPTVDELITLVDYGALSPSIKTAYFPNTASSNDYWSYALESSGDYNPWGVYGNGTAMSTLESFHFNIRLVRRDAPLIISANSSEVNGLAPFQTLLSCVVESGVAPYSFSWDFGDGSPGGDEQSPEHTFENPGVYTATVSVIDDSGQTESASITITARQTNTEAECLSFDEQLRMRIPCVDYNATQYSFSMNYIDPLSWELDASSLAIASDQNNCLSFDSNLSLDIPCADYNGTKFGFMLQYIDNLTWNLDLESVEIKGRRHNAGQF